MSLKSTPQKKVVGIHASKEAVEFVVKKQKDVLNGSNAYKIVQ